MTTRNVRWAATVLAARLRFVHQDENYMGVWHLAQAHLGPYQGASYADELDALEAALEAEPSAEAPSPAILAALADYAAKLAAWDARPQEGNAAHAFGDAGLVDGLAAALRDARGRAALDALLGGGS